MHPRQSLPWIVIKLSGEPSGLRRSLHTFIDDLVVQAVQSQFKAVCDAKFFVDFAETVLYDLFDGSQLRCNIFVALPSVMQVMIAVCLGERRRSVADLASQLPGHG